MMLAVCPIWMSKWRGSWIKRLVPPAVPNPRETLTRARMALTRRDIVILALLACLASGVALIRQPASPSLAAHDTAIREVILQQIDAFGRGDDAAALRLPHPIFRHSLSDGSFYCHGQSALSARLYRRINWHFPTPPAPCKHARNARSAGRYNRPSRAQHACALHHAKTAGRIMEDRRLSFDRNGSVGYLT